MATLKRPLLDRLHGDRLAHLRATMRTRDVPALFTSDPINISYAVGARNMTVFSMMGASRFLFVPVDGPTTLWEFAGGEHLASGLSTVGEVRVAQGVTGLTDGYTENCHDFAVEVAALCRQRNGVDLRLAVERFDHPVTDALRGAGLELTSATDTFMAARQLKTPAELEVMRVAIERVEAGIGEMAAGIEPGPTEIEIWAGFHRHLIANEGEYVSTRLVQSGARTFPYFNEAGPFPVTDGDLFCIDTDAIGFGGYAVDLSRTYVIGDGDASAEQRSLHSMTLDQLHHNAGLLAPGRSFESFAREAWRLPERMKPHRYYSLAHGLGMSGESPNLPPFVDGEPYRPQGEFLPGMVICVESYLGDPDIARGVKLEDQYLITDDGVERLTTAPFDARLA